MPETTVATRIHFDIVPLLNEYLYLQSELDPKTIQELYIYLQRYWESYVDYKTQQLFPFDPNNLKVASIILETARSKQKEPTDQSQVLTPLQLRELSEFAESARQAQEQVKQEIQAKSEARQRRLKQTQSAVPQEAKPVVENLIETVSTQIQSSPTIAALPPDLSQLVSTLAVADATLDALETLAQANTQAQAEAELKQTLTKPSLVSLSESQISQVIQATRPPVTTTPPPEFSAPTSTVVYQAAPSPLQTEAFKSAVKNAVPSPIPLPRTLYIYVTKDGQPLDPKSIPPDLLPLLAVNDEDFDALSKSFANGQATPEQIQALARLLPLGITPQRLNQLTEKITHPKLKTAFVSYTAPLVSIQQGERTSTPSEKSKVTKYFQFLSRGSGYEIHIQSTPPGTQHSGVALNITPSIPGGLPQLAVKRFISQPLQKYAIGYVQKIAPEAAAKFVAGQASVTAARSAFQKSMAQVAIKVAPALAAKLGITALAGAAGPPGWLILAAQAVKEGASYIGKQIRGAVTNLVSKVLGVDLKKVDPKAIFLGGLGLATLGSLLLPSVAGIALVGTGAVASLATLTSGGVALGAGIAGGIGGFITTFPGLLLAGGVGAWLVAVVVGAMVIPILLTLFIVFTSHSAFLAQPGPSSTFRPGLPAGGNYPTCWPTTGIITQGPCTGNTGLSHCVLDNNAIDIADNMGTPVYATHDGIAIAHPSSSTSGNGGYGNYVTVASAEGGFTTLYAHLSVITFSGTLPVTAGALIGEQGFGGTGVHLHYELKGISASVDEIVPDYKIQSPATGCFAKDEGGSSTPPAIPSP